LYMSLFFFFSSRRRHTRFSRDWSSDVCSSDLQLIFLILGAAGVLFTLVMLAVREPARRGVGAGVAVPLAEVGRYIRDNRRTVLCHNFGFAGLAFAGYGSAAWIPTFYIRTYGWDAGQVGIVYGSLVAVFGCLGIVF